jgi:probable HAF family extracellular repeat protein
VLWEDGSIIDLGTLGGAANDSGAYGINEHGQIVGISSTGREPFESPHACTWEKAVITDFGPGEALFINQRGQLLSYYGSTIWTK